MMKSLFDQDVAVQSANRTDNSVVAPLRGIVAAAETTLIDALARENIVVSFVIYTPAQPNVAVGDCLIVDGVVYAVVAPTRPYVSDALNMRVFVTPCSSGTLA